MATHPFRHLILAAAGLALVLGGCRGGEAPELTANATGTPGASGRPPGVATAQTRAIGQAQNGTLAVWLTSFAVLPWTAHVDQPGRHTFTVSNRSPQRHSFAVIQFDGAINGLPLSTDLIATKQVNVVAQTDAIEPGREADLTVDLPAGRYVLTSLLSRDYADGMAAAFTVGGQAPTGPRPKQPPDGALGVYLLEYGAFASNGQVRGGKTNVTVQNLGTRAREFALIRWRGADDALPMQDGAVLLDGLQEVHRFDALLAGEERQVEVNLQGGFSYMVVSLTKGEYEKGIRTQVKVN